MRVLWETSGSENTLFARVVREEHGGNIDEFFRSEEGQLNLYAQDTASRAYRRADELRQVAAHIARDAPPIYAREEGVPVFEPSQAQAIEVISPEDKAKAFADKRIKAKGIKAFGARVAAQKKKEDLAIKAAQVETLRDKHAQRSALSELRELQEDRRQRAAAKKIQRMFRGRVIESRFEKRKVEKLEAKRARETAEEARAVKAARAAEDARKTAEVQAAREQRIKARGIEGFKRGGEIAAARTERLRDALGRYTRAQTAKIFGRLSGGAEARRMAREAAAEEARQAKVARKERLAAAEAKFADAKKRLDLSRQGRALRTMVGEQQKRDRDREEKAAQVAARTAAAQERAVKATAAKAIDLMGKGAKAKAATRTATLRGAFRGVQVKREAREEARAQQLRRIAALVRDMPTKTQLRVEDMSPVQAGGTQIEKIYVAPTAEHDADVPLIAVGASGAGLMCAIHALGLDPNDQQVVRPLLEATGSLAGNIEIDSPLWQLMADVYGWRIQVFLTRAPIVNKAGKTPINRPVILDSPLVDVGNQAHPPRRIILTHHGEVLGVSMGHYASLVEPDDIPRLRELTAPGRGGYLGFGPNGFPTPSTQREIEAHEAAARAEEERRRREEARRAQEEYDANIEGRYEEARAEGELGSAMAYRPRRSDELHDEQVGELISPAELKRTARAATRRTIDSILSEAWSISQRIATWRKIDKSLAISESNVSYAASVLRKEKQKEAEKIADARRQAEIEAKASMMAVKEAEARALHERHEEIRRAALFGKAGMFMLKKMFATTQAKKLGAKAVIGQEVAPGSGAPIPFRPPAFDSALDKKFAGFLSDGSGPRPPRVDGTVTSPAEMPSSYAQPEASKSVGGPSGSTRMSMPIKWPRRGLIDGPDGTIGTSGPHGTVLGYAMHAARIASTAITAQITGTSVISAIGLATFNPIGLLISVGNFLFNWFRRKKRKEKERLIGEIQGLQSQLNAAAEAANKEARRIVDLEGQAQAILAPFHMQYDAQITRVKLPPEHRYPSTLDDTDDMRRVAAELRLHAQEFAQYREALLRAADRARAEIMSQIRVLGAHQAFQGRVRTYKARLIEYGAYARGLAEQAGQMGYANGAHPALPANPFEHLVLDDPAWLTVQDFDERSLSTATADLERRFELLREAEAQIRGSKTWLGGNAESNAALDVPRVSPSSIPAPMIALEAEAMSRLDAIARALKGIKIAPRPHDGKHLDGIDQGIAYLGGDVDAAEAVITRRLEELRAAARRGEDITDILEQGIGTDVLRIAAARDGGIRVTTNLQPESEMRGIQDDVVAHVRIDRDAIASVTTEIAAARKPRQPTPSKKEAPATTVPQGVAPVLPMAGLTPRQLRGLTPEQLEGLTPRQLEGLTPWQLRELTPEQFRGLTPEQFRGLTPEQLEELTPEQLKGLTPEQFRGLTPEQLKGLTPEQLKGLTPRQLEELTPEQLRELTPRQLRGLTPEQFRELTPWQLRGLTPEQL
jgi:hypothetical protein